MWQNRKTKGKTNFSNQKLHMRTSFFKRIYEKAKDLAGVFLHGVEKCVGKLIVVAVVI